MKKLIVCLMLFCSCAFAKETMKIVMARPPGGSQDMLARQFQKVISETENINVIVLNRPGGDGAVAANEIIADKSTDYSVFLVGTPVFIYATGNTAKILDNLELVMPISDGSGFMFVTHKNSKFQTWKDVVDYAKNNNVNIGAPSRQTTFLVEDVFQHSKANMIPFQGDSPVFLNLLNNSLDVGIVNVAGNLSRLDDMGLMPLAAGIDIGKNVPLIKSPHATYANAIFISADVSKEKAERIHDMFSRALSNPAMVEFYKKSEYSVPKLDRKQFFKDLNSRINAVKNHNQ